jgi:hypothetical protein
MCYRSREGLLKFEARISKYETNPNALNSNDKNKRYKPIFLRIADRHTPEKSLVLNIGNSNFVFLPAAGG